MALTREELIKKKERGELEYTEIIVKKEYPIGWVILNRPEKNNAISGGITGMRSQLTQAYKEMADDPEIRAFITMGAGDCFCAGIDQSTPDQVQVEPRDKGWAKDKEHEPWVAYSLMDPFTKTNPEARYPKRGYMDCLWNNPKPSIALVDSYCLGGGMELINVHDIVYATPEAVFAYPPIQMGSAITIEMLPPWILGLRKTMDMALSGRFITAEEAYNCGLITQIVPKDGLVEEGKKYALGTAKIPPMTNYFSKMVVHKYFEQLGMDMAIEYCHCFTAMMERTDLPGHYHDYFNLIREKGFKEAYKTQREQYGFPDEVMEREVARQRAIKEERKKLGEEREKKGK